MLVQTLPTQQHTTGQRQGFTMIVLESVNTTAVDSQWGPQFTQLFTARGLEGSENQSESC